MARCRRRCSVTMNKMNLKVMMSTMKVRHKLRRAARLRQAMESWPPIAGTFFFRDKDDDEDMQTALVDSLPRQRGILVTQLEKKLGRTVLKVETRGDKGSSAPVVNDGDLVLFVMDHWNSIKGDELAQVEELIAKFALALDTYSQERRPQAKPTARASRSRRSSSTPPVGADHAMAPVAHQLWEFSCRGELLGKLVPFIRRLCRLLRFSEAHTAHSAAIGLVARLARKEKYSVTVKEARVVSAMAQALTTAPKTSVVHMAEAAVNCVAQLAQHKAGLHILSSERGPTLLAAAIKIALEHKATLLLRYGSVLERMWAAPSLLAVAARQAGAADPVLHASHDDGELRRGDA